MPGSFPRAIYKHVTAGRYSYGEFENIDAGSSKENQNKPAVGCGQELHADDIVPPMDNADADFVDSIMSTEVACVSSAPVSRSNNDLTLLDTSISQIDKRKRDASNEKDSDSSRDSVNLSKKAKHRTLKGKGNRQKAKKLRKFEETVKNKEESVGVSGCEDSDISRTLKALTLLEDKMVKSFDGIKACNREIQSSLQKEIQSVRKEFNERMEGLSKKVEKKVTETLQKSMDDKINSAKSALQKDLRKNIVKDVSKKLELHIRDSTDRINQLGREHTRDR